MPRHEKADPAIVEALGLDEARTAMTQHGSSGFASTYKITSSSPDGAEWTYFIKTGRGPESQVMFRGASLPHSRENTAFQCCSPKTGDRSRDALNRC